MLPPQIVQGWGPGSPPVAAPQAGRELRSRSPPRTSFFSFVYLSPHSFPVCWPPGKAQPPPSPRGQGRQRLGLLRRGSRFLSCPVPLPEATFVGVSAAGRPVSRPSFQPPAFSSSHLLHEGVLGGAGPVLPWVTFPKALKLLGLIALHCTPCKKQMCLPSGDSEFQKVLQECGPWLGLRGSPE